MTSADISLEVRLAHPSDYKKVERLCRRAAGPHDYVLWILREVILIWVSAMIAALASKILDDLLKHPPGAPRRIQWIVTGLVWIFLVFLVTGVILLFLSRIGLFGLAG